MQKQGEKDGAAPPPSVQQDEILDSDDDHATKESSHDLKRLKKSAAVLEDEGYDFKDDDDNSSFNNCNNGSGSDKRSTSKGDSGMGHASVGREHGSAEIAQKQRSRHDRSQSSQSHRSNSSGSRHRSTPSSSSSKRKRTGDSKESWSSRSRSRSRSRSNSPTSERRPFQTYFERLKAEWGKEPWQDFELLQNNVLGPGSKGSVGPGATPTLPVRTDDPDQEEVDDRCNCSPVDSPTAPTCYDSSCHNFATMQECRVEKCHPGCKNQRIQRRENSNVQVFDAVGKGMGLRLLEPAAKGQFIAEYVGEIITRKELNKRMISSAGTRKLYMMQLGDNTYLDAKRKGGIARFVNHSCEPTCRLEQWTARGQPRCAVFTLRALKAGEELSFDYQWEAHELREATKCLCGTPSCRGTIEVLNPNAESGGGPFARGRVKASAMGVWRTPNEGEYANPEGLIGRRVRVYFDGDCTYFEAKVMRYNAERKTHMLLYAGEGDSVNDELEEDLIGVQGKIQGIDKWQIWEESDRVVNIKKKDTNDTASVARSTAVSIVPQGNSLAMPMAMPMPMNKWKNFNRFGSPLQPGMGLGMAMGPSGGFPGMMPGPPMTLRPPPPHPPPLPPPVGPRVAEEYLVPSKDTGQVSSDSEVVQAIKGKTSVHLELLETDDPRAVECPTGQRLLRVAGGRDQVNMAVDMLRSKVLSLRPLEEWLAAERRRKAQEAAETKDLEADANAQVNRVRQRWCIGSDWHCFSKAVISMVANNKNVADLRRNALHVVRQVAESGAGKISNPAPLIFHASILIHRYLAIINVPNVSSTTASSEVSTSTSNSTTTTITISNANGSSKTVSNKLVAVSSSSVKDSAGSLKDTGGSTNGSAAISNGTSGASSSVVTGATAGRFQMETNFYVLATACLLLANKSLRTRVGSSRPRRREELLRSAYGVQFRGRAVERGTAEAIKWEGKLAAAELEVLTALGFDVHITDPLEVLDQQRVQKFISSACHSKASSLVVESVTQGCTAWLRFEPGVVALSVLLLAIGTTATREELITRAQTLAVNAGGTWPAVLACTQSLARSLPSLASEESDGEEGPAKIAAALRQVPAADPMQYPDYEPPLMAAQNRLRQRRRAEDNVFDTKLRTTDLLMMRKAQDRAGLHGGLGGLQGIKGLAGFGSTLASNKFVRAAIREEDLLSAGLECIVPYLEPWKGFTMIPPLAGAGGGNVLEVYLQRWPADKKEGDSGGCGLSSSGMSELALFQELHSYSAVTTGHDTLLVPLAVVMGAGMKPTGKLGASRSPHDRTGSSKLNGKASDIMEGEGQTPTTIGMSTRMDPLSPLGTGGHVSVSMALGSDQRSLSGAGASLGADMDPSFASGSAVGSISGAVGSDGEGERAGASQIPDELLSPSYLLLEPVRYTLAEILRLCRRPMVLPGPLVKSMLQDLLGAVALCHDRNIVIKSIDAEKVYLDQRGRLKLGCLAQAMMVSPKDKETAASASHRDKLRQDAGSNGVDADDMEVEDTPEGRKAAHREGKWKMKQEKLARDNVCKKAVASMLKEGEPSKTVLWAMAPEVMVDQKQPHSPATDIWAVGCLAAQLALGKPIFGGRTRKQQLEYVFKCCGSPGQGRWPDGNKAPLYRHLRPVDKDGKSLHFKPRLDKVLAAEGHKGVPLDPGLAILLQGLLKLDARHRHSAREALASPYFAPIPGLREEINDAWFNLRGDLDKVQMGVATPDQLRGTYAAANAPAGPPKPTPPPISSQISSRDMDDPSDSYGYSSPTLEGRGDISEKAVVPEGRNGHDGKRERMDHTDRNSHGSVHLRLEPGGGVERLDPMTIDSGFEFTSGGLGEDRPRGEDGKVRHLKGGASRSWSPRSGGRRGRSPDNDRGLRDSHRERERDWGTERTRSRDMDRERFKDKERKRKRERDRQRERQRKRERGDVRSRGDHGRLNERSGKEAWRRDDGDGERERWGGRSGRF